MSVIVTVTCKITRMLRSRHSNVMTKASARPLCCSASVAITVAMQPADEKNAGIASSLTR